MAVRSFLPYIRIHPSLHIPLAWGCLLLDWWFHKLHSPMCGQRHSRSESNLQTYGITSLHCKRNYNGELKHWWISSRENMTSLYKEIYWLYRFKTCWPFICQLKLRMDTHSPKKKKTNSIINVITKLHWSNVRTCLQIFFSELNFC